MQTDSDCIILSNKIDGQTFFNVVKNVRIDIFTSVCCIILILLICAIILLLFKTREIEKLANIATHDSYSL